MAQSAASDLRSLRDAVLSTGFYALHYKAAAANQKGGLTVKYTPTGPTETIYFQQLGRRSNKNEFLKALRKLCESVVDAFPNFNGPAPTLDSLVGGFREIGYATKAVKRNDDVLIALEPDSKRLLRCTTYKPRRILGAGATKGSDGVFDMAENSRPVTLGGIISAAQKVLAANRANGNAATTNAANSAKRGPRAAASSSNEFTTLLAADGTEPETLRRIKQLRNALVGAYKRATTLGHVNVLTQLNRLGVGARGAEKTSPKAKVKDVIGKGKEKKKKKKKKGTATAMKRKKRKQQATTPKPAAKKRKAAESPAEVEVPLFAMF